MSRYHNYDHPGYGEREPLDNNYHHGSPAPNSPSPYQDQDQDYGYDHPPQQQQRQQQQQQQSYQYQPQQPQYHQNDYAPDGYQYEQPEAHPSQQIHGAHPDSSFGRLRAERQNARDGGYANDNSQYSRAGAAGAAAGYGASASGPPQPPPHGNYGVTPGADNFGQGASGGMAGIAYTIADQNARQSGVEAMRGMEPQSRSDPYNADPYNAPSMPQPAYGQHSPSAGYYAQQRPGPGVPDPESHTSLTPLGAAAVPPGAGTPSRTPVGHGFGAVPQDPYSDDPYQAYSTTRSNDPHLGVVNPNDIADDGDDGLGYRRPQRTSLLSLSHSERGSSTTGPGASVAAGAAAAGGMAGAVGGLPGRNGGGSGGYGPVNNASVIDLDRGPGAEKSWGETPPTNRKRWKLVAIIVGVIVVIGAIVGGVLGGVLANRGGDTDGNNGSSGGNSGQSADEDQKQNGDLGINSDEIKDLMDNDDLHKVFYGFDYTPLNVQYPECIHNPPSQNNITRDIAVLSQLTNIVRLYGTDCNQTQMVLHAIDRLELDDMKIFMGVWIDGNSSTNARQLDQMWDILDEYGEDPFEGVIVANEILFRKEMSLTELGDLLEEVRENMTTRGIDLPVATSDLGNDWDQGLADASDYVMSNIHPFFAPQPADGAASWTWTFWDTWNKPFWKSENDRNIIAEIGWPTSGGTNCPNEQDTCASGEGAVANVEGLNTLLNDFVCQSMRNSTRYLWFSAFDEPWKARFDVEGKEWESKWGLMDVNRNIKDGVKIPDCGGRTVDRV